MELELIIDVILTSPIKSHMEHGAMVFFDDIYIGCRNRGLDNKDIIESAIEKLAKDGALEAIYMSSPGFEELMIGVKLSCG